MNEIHYRAFAGDRDGHRWYDSCSDGGSCCSKGYGEGNKLPDDPHLAKMKFMMALDPSDVYGVVMIPSEVLTNGYVVPAVHGVYYRIKRE